MIKQTLALVCALVMAVATSFGAGAKFAPNQLVKKVYDTKGSPEQMCRNTEKIDITKLGIADQLALTQIRSACKGDPKKMIWSFAALTPTMREELEKRYPGITEWYLNSAYQKKIDLRVFEKEPAQGIRLADLEQFMGGAGKQPIEPTNSVELIKFLTLRMQYELYKSENLQIQGDYAKIVQLFNSLNEDTKQIIRDMGYFNTWQAQQNLIEIKQTHGTYVVSGVKPIQVSAFPRCPEGKNIPVDNEPGALPDSYGIILKGLEGGDLSFISAAKAKKLNTWGNSYNDVVRQLVFLHLATLGETQVQRNSMKISLVQQWDNLVNNQGEKYLISLGFDRKILEQAQAYYSCILGLQEIVPGGGPIAALPPDPYQAPVQPATPATRTEEYRSVYNAYSLDSAVRHFLVEEINNREDELAGTCLTAKALNDSTYEVILDKCDHSKEVFDVKKTTHEGMGKFFKYCSNLVVHEIERGATIVPLTYSVVIVGTADTIPYQSNQDLALKRAEYIEANLGFRTKTATSVSLEPITGLPAGQRYAALRFILSRTRTSSN